MDTTSIQNIYAEKKFVQCPKSEEDPIFDEDLVRKAYADRLNGGVTLWGWERESVVAGTWSYVLDPNQFCNGNYRNSSNNNGDGLDFLRYLAEGTYTIKLLGLQQTNQAILDIAVDGTVLASFDKYGALAYNTVWNDTGNVIATSGIKTIRVVVNGRNPLSTGWFGHFTMIVFYRTG